MCVQHSLLYSSFVKYVKSIYWRILLLLFKFCYHLSTVKQSAQDDIISEFEYNIGEIKFKFKELYEFCETTRSK